MKAEGIAAISTSGNTFSVVIAFDNDNGVTGKPSKLQFAKLTFMISNTENSMEAARRAARK
jgi:hypothetical protein